MFLPKGSSYSGPDLRKEIEHKVRQLLGRTELKEIASTAKVLVEISENTSSQNMFPQQNLKNDGSDQQFNSILPPNKNVSGLNTQKIYLSPRTTEKQKLKKTVNP